MNVSRPYLLVAALAIVGCSGKNATQTPGTAPTTVPPANVGLGIPEDLVSDGLKAMGYPFEKTIVYKVTGFPAGSSSTQTMRASFEAKDGKNELTFNYEGQPSNLPSESYSLDKDGIFGIAAGGDVITPKVKAMPTAITMGDHWPSKGSLKDGTISMDTVLTVVRREKVKVAAGEYDAILVTESGTIKVGSSPPAKVEGKSWYVDGIGPVKRSITQTDSAGKTSNLLMEATEVK